MVPDILIIMTGFWRQQEDTTIGQSEEESSSTRTKLSCAGWTKKIISDWFQCKKAAILEQSIHVL